MNKHSLFENVYDNPTVNTLCTCCARRENVCDLHLFNYFCGSISAPKCLKLLAV